MKPSQSIPNTVYIPINDHDLLGIMRASRTTLPVNEETIEFGGRTINVFQNPEDVKQAHLYMGRVFILEMTSGVFITVVDGQRFHDTSRDTLERDVYLIADRAYGLFDPYRATNAWEAQVEYDAFLINHGMPEATIRAHAGVLYASPPASLPKLAQIHYLLNLANLQEAATGDVA